LEDWINSLSGTPAQAPPTVAPNGGLFFNNVNISLTAPDTNAALFYTLDGGTPTANSLRYTSPFNLTSNAVVSASAIRTGYVNSLSTSASFVVQPIRFTSEGFSNGMFRLEFLGTAGSNYVLLASTNLMDWTPVLTNPATTNVLNFIDPASSNIGNRFYRVLQQ
jgi:hypothetical protein